LVEESVDPSRWGRSLVGREGLELLEESFELIAERGHEELRKVG
jgi:hypothetical protein